LYLAIDKTDADIHGENENSI